MDTYLLHLPSYAGVIVGKKGTKKGSEFPSYPSLQANLMLAHAAFAAC